MEDKMKVENMSSQSGGKVPNQFIITDDEGRVFFQSYDTIIACVAFGKKTQLDVNCWDYSTTTGKYRNIFLGETIAHAQARDDRFRADLGGCGGGNDDLNRGHPGRDPDVRVALQ